MTVLCFLCIILGTRAAKEATSLLGMLLPEMFRECIIELERGETMSTLKNRLEEEHFVREQAEKLRLLAEEKRKAISAEEEQKAKELHYMKCPKCGHDLQEIKWRSVKVDKCYSCKGVYLDDGELEKLAGPEHNTTFVRDFINVFKMKSS